MVFKVDKGLKSVSIFSLHSQRSQFVGLNHISRSIQGMDHCLTTILRRVGFACFGMRNICHVALHLIPQPLVIYNHGYYSHTRSSYLYSIMQRRSELHSVLVYIGNCEVYGDNKLCGSGLMIARRWNFTKWKLLLSVTMRLTDGVTSI